jgi:hypothetical protein
MSTEELLENQREHLAGLLETIHRCVYFLSASTNTIAWPLSGDYLSEHKKRQSTL